MIAWEMAPRPSLAVCLGGARQVAQSLRATKQEWCSGQMPQQWRSSVMHHDPCVRG